MEGGAHLWKAPQLVDLFWAELSKSLLLSRGNHPLLSFSGHRVQVAVLQFEGIVRELEASFMHSLQQDRCQIKMCAKPLNKKQDYSLANARLIVSHGFLMFCTYRQSNKMWDKSQNKADLLIFGEG